MSKARELFRFVIYYFIVFLLIARGISTIPLAFFQVRIY
nr:MAG TPA: hypothetical protein [Caudoviricetes sp.]